MSKQPPDHAGLVAALDNHINASAHYSGHVNGISRRELIEWREAIAALSRTSGRLTSRTVGEAIVAGAYAGIEGTINDVRLQVTRGGYTTEFALDEITEILNAAIAASQEE